MPQLSQRFATLVLCVAALSAAHAQQSATQQPPTAAAALPRIVPVRPIQPPATPLPAESASANVTRFSFVAYGDTRCDCRIPGTDLRTLFPGGPENETEHSAVVDALVEKVKLLAGTPYPVRFVAQSGDATWRGADGERWEQFTPIAEQITLGANLPFFFVPGNHDEPGADGTPDHAIGLHNTLSAISRLIPPEGSPRRLNGYATFGVGYGNVFLIGFDSNTAGDVAQLAWVTDQLEHLDRSRYRHIVAVFHHPAFTSGRYSGAVSEARLPNGQTAAAGAVPAPQTTAIRNLYMPLFRKHHVRMILAGHDHLFDHWVERYTDGGVEYRIDQIVSGGGGAPSYTYTGEPDLKEYMAAGASQNVRVEHIARPSPIVEENLHHFLVIQVDGDKLSLEIVASRGQALAPYGGKATLDLNK